MRLGKRAYSLLVFLGVAILGGILAAGFVVPVVSMVSTTGRDAALSLDALPAELKTPDQSERSKVVMADGSLLTYFYNENRVYEPLANIAPIMQEAQVAIEDHRFFEHGAIDLQGTLRALVSTSQGVTQGGSSITQQYVRLVLIETAEANNDAEARAAATENTLARKIRELRFAIALEKEYPKEQILERYLNISYYGDGAYGVEAAARHYFGVSAKDLNLAQSAMLAGLVRNPVTTNPVKYPQVAIERRNNVIDRMVELGKVTKEEGEAAKAEPFDQDKVTENKLDCGNARFPFICDYAKRVLLSDQSSDLGATPEEREYRLYRGGLTIQLTVDPKIQKQSEKTIASYIDPRDPVVSVITMLEPSTGNIVAMAQSRPKMGDNKENDGKDKWRGETYYNYAVSHAMGGADGFQGGSTFKAFVAAAALENDMGAYGKYNAKRVMTLDGPFKSCEGSFMLDKPWKVTNASPSGVMDMFAGVKGSVNTYFAQLIQAVGGCEAVKMADKLGLEIGLPKEDFPDVLSYDSIPSFTLGTIEVPPLSLVEAYATFANRGIHCEPVIVSSISTRQGVALKVPDADCQRVISKDVADAINKIFQGPYNGGTATPAKISGVQMAGKTGTVPDNKAVWTVGYTSGIAAAAVMSFDNDPRFAKFWKERNGRFLNGAYLKYSEHYVYGRSGSEAGCWSVPGCS
ncbi:MAG: transglycosylase domain-containing protein [Propionicimonas sp.]